MQNALQPQNFHNPCPAEVTKKVAYERIKRKFNEEPI